MSVVRSDKPGFLTSLERTNVMLTRCRRGLVVVSSKAFLKSTGASTLIGRLAQYCEKPPGKNTWVDWKAVSQNTCDLPGVDGKSSRLTYVVPPVRKSQRKSKK